jgi:hypothetical protein
MADKTHKPVDTEYRVIEPLQHDGFSYQPQDKIVLSEQAASVLLANNLICKHELLHETKPD